MPHKTLRETPPIRMFSLKWRTPTRQLGSHFQPRKDMLTTKNTTLPPQPQVNRFPNPTTRSFFQLLRTQEPKCRRETQKKLKLNLQLTTQERQRRSNLLPMDLLKMRSAFQARRPRNSTYICMMAYLDCGFTAY